MYEYPTPGERPGGLRIEKNDLRLLLSNMLQVKLGLVSESEGQKNQFRDWFDKGGASLVSEALKEITQEQLENGEGMDELVAAYQQYRGQQTLH